MGRGGRGAAFEVERIVEVWRVVLVFRVGFGVVIIVFSFGLVRFYGVLIVGRVRRYVLVYY